MMEAVPSAAEAQVKSGVEFVVKNMAVVFLQML
jgi:hypothetical protein